MDFEDAGDYTCEASNGVGLAKSYSINLEVLAKPRFITEPEIETAAEGEEVSNFLFNFHLIIQFVFNLYLFYCK